MPKSRKKKKLEKEIPEKELDLDWILAIDCEPWVKA